MICLVLLAWSLARSIVLSGGRWILLSDAGHYAISVVDAFFLFENSFAVKYLYLWYHLFWFALFFWVGAVRSHHEFLLSFTFQIGYVFTKCLFLFFAVLAMSESWETIFFCLVIYGRFTLAWVGGMTYLTHGFGFCFIAFKVVACDVIFIMFFWFKSSFFWLTWRILRVGVAEVV